MQETVSLPEAQALNDDSHVWSDKVNEMTLIPVRYVLHNRHEQLLNTTTISLCLLSTPKETLQL